MLVEDSGFIDQALTAVGFTSKTEFYTHKRIGNSLCFVSFYITGTGDGTDVTLSLPYAAKSQTNYYQSFSVGKCLDKGAAVMSVYGVIDPGASTVVFTIGDGTAWQATGTRTIAGQFLYEIEA